MIRNRAFLLLFLLGLTTVVTACDFGGNRAEEEQEVPNVAPEATDVDPEATDNETEADEGESEAEEGEGTEGENDSENG